MISAALAALVLLADQAGAAQSAPDNAPSAKPARTPHTVSEATAVADGKAKASDDPLAIVCHSEPVLGSRLTVKRCTTKGDAAVNKFEQRQELERMQGATYQH